MPLRINSYNKYRNNPTHLGGKTFASRAEANRYTELNLLVRANKIKNLVCQPRFELQESFTYNGKVERAIVYVADFSYIENGEVVIEDVKGMRTDVYLLKRKLFLKKYPHLKFIEI